MTDVRIWLAPWIGDPLASERKLRLLNVRLIGLALQRLVAFRSEAMLQDAVKGLAASRLFCP